jgi:hypothetical protein
MKVGEAISAIFECYATKAGKPRWGDKTPMYMRHLPLLEKLFPDAQYVHLVRDGRDAALSFLEMPEGTFTRTWAHPDDVAQFACLWRKEVGDARLLGQRVGPGRYLEVRYEDLVTATSQVVESICAFASLPFEPQMIEYAGAVDVSDKPHQQRLLQSPTAGLRSWREDMSSTDARAFDAIAGDRLSELGYELCDPLPRAFNPRARAALGWYDLRLGAWNAAAAAFQRSPMWRRRHPPL